MEYENINALAIGSVNPFEDTETFEMEKAQNEMNNHAGNIDLEIESPFSNMSDAFIDEETNSGKDQEFVELLAEISDVEFNEVLSDMTAEIQNELFGGFEGETFTNSDGALLEKNAERYFEPILNEIDASIDTMAALVNENEFEGEQSILQTIEEYEHQPTHNFSPVQEQFFKKVFNKVKKAAKKVVGKAKKIAKRAIKTVGKAASKFNPIRIALNKLKRVVRPLLKRVLSTLIGKLPKNLRPFAKTLAKKYLRLETTEFEGDLVEPDYEAIEMEFDSALAHLAIANTEYESEQELVNYESAVNSDFYDGQNELVNYQNAKEDFVHEISKEEQLGPAVERFLPAILPILKIGLRLLGRKKVVNFLAGLIAKLIRKWIPPTVARPLASTIVDLGLRTIGLETNEEEQELLAYEAIADTVEDTIRFLVQDSELTELETLSDDEAMELLASKTLPAFRKATIKNFPGNYIKKNLRTSSIDGTWVALPRRGRKKYKKFTKVFEVEITPQMAKGIESFGDTTLAQFFKENLTLNGNTNVGAKVHLFEALPGFGLKQISQNEKTNGLGSSNSTSSHQLHPLTVNAATLLLKEPDLGKDVANNLLNSRTKINVGQRFYYLEIPNAAVRLPRVQTGQNGRIKRVSIARNNDFQLEINFIKSKVVYNYYFSEVAANELVKSFTKGDKAKVAHMIKSNLKDAFSKVLSKRLGSKVKIIHEATPELYLDRFVEEENFLGNLTKNLLRNLIKSLAKKFGMAGYKVLKTHFKTSLNDFEGELAKPNDGVTVRLVWSKISGMQQLRSLIRIIRGKKGNINIGNLELPKIEKPTVQIKAGKQFS